jgi:hypothetical protein
MKFARVKGGGADHADGAPTDSLLPREPQAASGSIPWNQSYRKGWNLIPQTSS